VSAQPLAAEAASLIAKETMNRFCHQGTKTQRKIFTLVPWCLCGDYAKFHTSGAAGQKNGQINRERNYPHRIDIIP